MITHRSNVTGYNHQWVTGAYCTGEVGIRESIAALNPSTLVSSLAAIGSAFQSLVVRGMKETRWSFVFEDTYGSFFCAPARVMPSTGFGMRWGETSLVPERILCIRTPTGFKGGLATFVDQCWHLHIVKYNIWHVVCISFLGLCMDKPSSVTLHGVQALDVCLVRRVPYSGCVFNTWPHKSLVCIVL